ncbi:protein kinase domain-containing protein [Thermocrinis minervae]|uniref:Putative serine/threonine protein kinase n=1 Tax=Thermocrinis minervae TaxID=381751 RepID=A0A1M6TF25_9AQUI|nr:protein kinase [Thermocrinis minervae]SHK55560.1 putative serine/threonine protein kinase [Thermocrinis minervae]
MRFEEFKSSLENLEKIGEGWRGIVYKAVYNSKQVAVKVAKSPEKEHAIRKEAEILNALKGNHNFPQILVVGEDFFVYEYVEGTPFEKLNLTQKEKLLVYSKLLDIAYYLDSIGISRDEFHDLRKNLLIKSDGNLCLMDFDRATFGKGHNLTQFLQLLRREGLITHEEAISLGKEYRKEPKKTYLHLKTLLERLVQEAT